MRSNFSKGDACVEWFLPTPREGVTALFFEDIPEDRGPEWGDGDPVHLCSGENPCLCIRGKEGDVKKFITEAIDELRILAESMGIQVCPSPKAPAGGGGWQKPLAPLLEEAVVSPAHQCRCGEKERCDNDVAKKEQENP